MVSGKVAIVCSDRCIGGVITDTVVPVFDGVVYSVDHGVGAVGICRCARCEGGEERRSRVIGTDKEDEQTECDDTADHEYL